MESNYRSAQIFVRDRLAGILSETDAGYVFAYDADYLADPSPARRQRRRRGRYTEDWASAQIPLS